MKDNNYQSLSTNMVPARVERTPRAPEMLVNMTSKTKALKFVSFRSE